MSPLTQVREALRYPLVRLAGGEITLASILTAVLILLAMGMVARFAARAVSRLLAGRGAADGLRFAVAKIVRWSFVLLGVLIALTTVGVRLDALLAGSAVLLLGIGIGLQGVAQNFVAGLTLLIERPVAKGDFVRIGNAFGSVVDIGLRATRIVTRDEVTIIVPNNELVTTQVVNHSVPSTNLRIAVPVGVAYGTAPELAREVLLGVAQADPLLLHEPAPEVRFDAFADSSLDFSLLVWIADPREDLATASRLRFAIAAALREARIAIPFPQRDLHIKSDLAAPAPPGASGAS
jgi:small-conductance mechanosensitive channel